MGAPALSPEQLLRAIQSLPTSIILTSLLALLSLAFSGSYLLILLVAHHPRPPTASENAYRTITSALKWSSSRPLPDTLRDAAEVEVSVVVPAYNEAARLPGMLAEAVSFLTRTYGPVASAIDAEKHPTKGRGWEILVVDDGSSDGTAGVALEWAKEHVALGDVKEGDVRIVALEKNRGKGGAVTHGMRHVRGRYAVFADADGASKFADLAMLMDRLKEVEMEGYGVAVGSRAHMVTTDAVVKRSFIRNLLMHSFHTLLRTFGIRSIHDTQCGFKLFSRASINAIFPLMHTEGWIFDIEILLLAFYQNIPVVEVPISWHEVEGTKMVLIKDSIRMAWDLGVVRGGYAFGVYKVGQGGPGR